MLLAKLKRRTLAETVVALNGLSIGELRELANANECFGDYGLASHCPVTQLLAKLGFKDVRLGAMDDDKQSTPTHPYFIYEAERVKSPFTLTCFAALFDTGEFPELVKPVPVTTKVSLAVARHLKFRLNYWNDKLEAQFPELSEK